MRAWIERQLEAPRFEDEESTRLAAMLTTILNWLISATVFVAPLIMAFDPPANRLKSAPLVASFFVALVGARFLMRRGRIDLAVPVTIGSLWLSVTYALVFLNTARSGNRHAYFLALMMAGLFRGGPAALLCALATALVLGILAAAEAYGLAMPEVYDPLTSWLMQATCLGIAAVLLSLAWRNIHDALDRARQNERAQAAGRQGMRYILDVTPDLHRLQPLESLLQSALRQLAGLLSAASASTAMPEGASVEKPESLTPDSFIALSDAGAALELRAATGRFSDRHPLDHYLGPAELEAIQHTLEGARIRHLEAATVVPLRVGEHALGVLYLDRRVQLDRDGELLGLFSSQVALAIRNTQLYEMATFDPLTGVYVRRVFEQFMQRELRRVFRAGQPLSLLLIDVDNMKHLNDSGGHLLGDRALMTVGSLLRREVRGSDIVARYGGDEFAIVLPDTPARVAAEVGQRILNGLASSRRADREMSLSCSLGLATLEAPQGRALEPAAVPASWFQHAAQRLLLASDMALYDAKRSGRGRLCEAPALRWDEDAAPRAMPGAAHDGC